MNSLTRKINRRLFSSRREKKVLSYFSDYDKQMLLYIINFKFANKINNNLDLIKEKYFTDNIIVFDKDRFDQTNYKNLKKKLDKTCPFRIIQEMRKSNKLIFFDFHYQYLIELEQGCLASWIETIMKPAKEGEMDGLYHQQLMKVSKRNSSLMKANEGLLYDLDREVGENVDMAHEIRELQSQQRQQLQPSAPPMISAETCY